MLKKMNKFVIVLLILLLMQYPIVGYSEIIKLPDGKIQMTQDDLMKLYKEIKTLENKCNDYKELVTNLEEKNRLLKQKIKVLEETVRDLNKLYTDQKINLTQELSLLKEKINKQLDIINYKDQLISIKNEKLKSKDKEMILMSVIGILTGVIVDRVLVK